MENKGHQKRYLYFYKRKINEMTEKIENPAMLKRIYQLAEYLYIHRKSEIFRDYPKVCVNLQTDVR